MLKAAIQLPNLDCLLQSELWHFHRYSYFLRKVLAEAGKRHPRLVHHMLMCGCCPPWGSFTSFSAGSGQSSLQGWYSGHPGKQNQKSPAWFWWLANRIFHHLLRQSHVMPHIATQNMKITLQNIFQIDVHLGRNLLFLHSLWIYCTLNISDVPDTTTLADELLFTSGVRPFSPLLIQRKTVPLT